MLAELFRQKRLEEAREKGYKEGYKKAKEELAKEQAINDPPAQQPSGEEPKQ